jgi:putative effector of murein hydrolase
VSATTPVEQDSIEHLDFDPRCTAAVVVIATLFGRVVGQNVTRCEKPSTLMSICLGCRARSFVCSEHHEAMFAVDVVHCGRCKRAGTVEHTFAFTPARG